MSNLDEPVNPLSPRQKNALYLASIGFSGEQIAEEMDIHLSAVNQYLSSARKKLGANNTAHAIAKALASGQLSLHHETSENEALGDFSSEEKYFVEQTEKYGLHLLRDLIARQTIGHNNFEQFTDPDWELFYQRYRTLISEIEEQRKIDASKN